MPMTWPRLADKALDRGLVQQGDAVPDRDLGHVMIEDRPQDGVAMAKGARVAVAHAEQAVAVGGEGAALDQPAFPGQGFDAVGTEDVGMGQVLAEVDAAGPVLGTGVGGCFDDGDREAGPGQADGRRQAGTAGAHDHHIVIGRHAGLLLATSFPVV